ncbi:Syntaxin 7 [Nesidiocoris tenuis]|uniref:Syntaxin 7 n=1 Tax=Nesidiocoris tenuis TaxID=355587 RepID=A0ABN7B5W1_9HEMI|nr:Syntaxin 7 [Nesidiocoris tenuis]
MDSYNSYQNGMEKKDFNQLAGNISSSIQKITQNVVSMEKMVKVLGTAQDTQELRQKWTKIQNYTNTLAKDTSENLLLLSKYPIPQSPSENRDYKMQKERLMEDLSAALNQFQLLQRSACQKEKEAVYQKRVNSGISTGIQPPPSKWNQGGEQLIELVSPTSQREMQMQLQQEEMDLRLIEEQEESIRQLEKNIVDVNDIFKKFGKLVHDQGEMVDNIESQIEGAKVYVSQGTENLRQAGRYKNKLRKCKFMMLIIPAIVLVCLFTLIFWQSK